jgi:hypothetical protein
MLFFKDRFDTLSFSACSAPSNGLILEFGVATGATISYLANCVALGGRTIYGFDSFMGLPEKWADYAVGHFACDPPSVPSNVELVIGLFADTLPAFLATHAGKAALIHIDCDLYASTYQVLYFLNERIVPGPSSRWTNTGSCKSTSAARSTIGWRRAIASAQCWRARWSS